MRGGEGEERTGPPRAAKCRMSPFPFLHWDYQTATIWLMAIETEVTVIECLPFIKVFGESVLTKPNH